MSVTVVVTGHRVVNKTDKNPCPCGTYIIVVEVRGGGQEKGRG